MKDSGEQCNRPFYCLYPKRCAKELRQVKTLGSTGGRSDFSAAWAWKDDAAINQERQQLFAIRRF